MLIGVDFDNTIVSYDRVFHRVAVEKGLIPDTLPVHKQAVRDHLRAIGREDAWTELQGYVYGARMADAAAFEGVCDCLAHWLRRGIDVHIISHKTRVPYLGPAYDLHAAAYGWLEQEGFFDPARVGLPREHVRFELTKAEKLRRIAETACTHFIDDLPEFLAEPAFPAGVTKLLFDPAREHRLQHGVGERFSSWQELERFVLQAEESV